MSWPVVLSLVVAASSACVFILRLFFRAELAEFRIALMEELNGRYMNAPMAQQLLKELASDLSRTRHDLRNDIMRMMHEGRPEGKR